MHKLAVLGVILLLLVPAFLSLYPAKAQELTLAETINQVTQGIDLNSISPQWGAIYPQVFGIANQSVFDVLIQKAANESDWANIIWVARLAELSGYNSQIINNSVTSALQNMLMAGSLPDTYNGFCLYDRYMINGYRYAQELNVPGWNINQAFMDTANAYLNLPKGSKYGEMLWINPARNYSEAYQNDRYFDEYAETVSMFLLLAQNGANSAITYNNQNLNPSSFMDDMWVNTQSLWNGNYYTYGSLIQEVECEMGNFAQVIAQYRNIRGDIPYFDRVNQDLEYKLLNTGWSSPGWGAPGIIRHAETAPQLRLAETLGAVISLQELYPTFNNQSQSNFRNMLASGWQSLVNSSLYNNGQFRFTDDSTDTPNGDATSLGAMLLLLYGIVPQTGSLAITPSNERYQDYQTCFSVTDWKFDYTNHLLRIPVYSGQLEFIFGSQSVTQQFDSNGVYNIAFASDWNSILSITKVSEITQNISAQPVTLQSIQRPSPTSTPAPTATPNHNSPTTSIPTTPTPTETTKPSSSPNPQQITTTPALTQKQKNSILDTWLFIGTIIALVVLISSSAFIIKQRKH